MAIVVAGALIAAAVYFGGKAPETYTAGEKQRDQQSAGDIAPVSDRDHVLGNRNAKVVIVEYSDTECPFCKVFHATMHRIMDSYGEGEVAWVYRHFPIAELHPHAAKQAEATECAAELGGNTGFWNYIDKLFETTNSNNTLDSAELPRIAQAIGLDVAKFNECLNSGKYTEAIGKAVESAVKAGARGTPYSVAISGNKKVVINGAQPYEVVKQTIDSLLK